MWFLGSLLALVSLVWAVDLIGLPLLRLLPWRQQSVARVFLGPVLGTGVVMLLATAVGWLGNGYRWWICLPLTLGLVAAGVCGGRRRLHPRRALVLAGFTGLASFPVLYPLLRFNAYNPFNDVFIYLTHAQWLQAHGFLEPAQPNAAHPALTLVAAFQDSGLRMGASFLLGWLQALFHLPRSYQVYPVAAALPLVVGSLAVGGGVAAACPGRRLESWLAALAAAVTLNGFAFGAEWGFLHQTYGLAFLTGALTLRGLELVHPEGDPNGFRTVSPNSRLRRSLPLALCTASLVWSYVELTPFVAAVLGLSYLIPWPGRRVPSWKQRLAQIWPPVLLVLALVNGEWPRAFRALQMQSSVQVGNPVAWHWWEFPAHALGLKAGIHDGAGWPTEIKANWLIGGGAVALVLALPLFRSWTSRRRGRFKGSRPVTLRLSALVPALLMVGLTVVAFAWFRWVTPNPWPEGLDNWPTGTGQSWSQFKLSNWAAPSLLVISVAMAAAALAGGWHKCLILAMILWCGISLAWNGQRAKPRVAAFLSAAGVADHPFAVYERLRMSLARVPTDAGIGLDIPSTDFSHAKTRLLLAYFLCDHVLVGDWSADAGLLPEYLPPPAGGSPEPVPDWWVRYRHKAVGGEPPPWGADCFRLESNPASPRTRAAITMP